MALKAPDHWWAKPGWAAYLQAPLAYVYGRLAARRMRRARPPSVDVPVLLVGNFTAGGAGKTPTVIVLAEAAAALGLKPGILTRGFGGRARRPLLVDPASHPARLVGDEALMLSRVAPTVVARRRLDGARRLIEAGCDFILMDDGFQSRRLATDYTLIVVDAARGIGNGFVLPAGPLRAPFREQLRHATAILCVGEGMGGETVVRAAARRGKPLFSASLSVRDDGGLSGRRVLAFAGIADPAKFYRTLEGLGAEIVIRQDFGDHQRLGKKEIAALLQTAENEDLLLATTEKDAARLVGEKPPADRLLALSHVVTVRMAFADPSAPALIVNSARQAFRRRRHSN